MKLRISKQKITTSYLSTLLMVVFMLLLLLRDVGGMSMNKFIFVAIAAVVFFLEDKNHMYQWIALMLPCIGGLPGTYIMCVAVIIFCFKQYRRIVLRRSGILICIALLLIELISMVWGSFDFFEYLRFAGVFLSSFIFIFDCDKTYEYSAIVEKFLLGTVIAIISLVGQTLRYYTLTEFLIKGVRFGDTISTYGIEKEGLQISFNENGLGALCCMSIIMSLLLVRCCKKKRYYSVTVLCAIVGFMTQSRSFLLTVGMGLMLYIFFSCESIKTFFSRLLGIIIGILVFCQTIIFLMPAYVENLLLRFQVDDLSAGRLGLFQEYWDGQLALPLSFPLGVGLQNYEQKIGATGASHMGYQQVMVTWGIIGLVLCLILFVLIIAQLKYTKRCQLLYVVPYFVFLVARLSAQIFSSSSYTLYFFILYACANLYIEKEAMQTNCLC